MSRPSSIQPCVAARNPLAWPRLAVWLWSTLAAQSLAAGQVASSLFAKVVFASVLLAGCGALSVHDDAVPTGDLVKQARSSLRGDAEERADGHRQLAWLCLLRGEACAELPAHGRAALPARPEAVPPAELLGTLALRALALDGTADLTERTHAWLDVAVAATTPLQSNAQLRELALAAAASAVSGLHARDGEAVAKSLRSRPDDAARLLDAGSAAGRWLRLRALSRVVADGDWPAAEPVAAGWVVPQVEVMQQPVSPRLALPLARWTPQAAAQSAGPTRQLGRSDEALGSPAALQRGAYALAVKRSGTWLFDVSVASVKASRALLTRFPRGFRAFAPVGGDWQALPASPVTADGVHAVALPAEVTTVRILAPLQTGPQVLEVTIVPADQLHLSEQAHGTLPAALGRALRQLAGLPEVHQLRQDRPLDAVVALQRQLLEQASALQPSAPDQSVLDGVLQSLPHHVEARLALVQRLLEDNNLTQAARWLADVSNPAALVVDRPEPSGSAVAAGVAQRADILLATSAVRHAEGLVDLAVAAMDQLLVRSEGRCQPRAAALQLGLDTLQREALRRWLPKGADRGTCVAHSVLEANAHRALGQTAEAAQLVEQAAARPQLAWGAAQLASELGLPFDPTLLPDAARWQAMEASWDGLTAAQREQALLQLLLDPQVSLSLKERALAAGAQLPWQPLVRDGLQLAAQPDEPNLVKGATQAWLLDQELVLLLPGGGAVRRVHQVLRVLSDAAAESVGEVAVPDGAELELARTVLSDGTVVQPAETADKSSVSLRMVEAGATVEYAQSIFVAADDAVTQATRLPTFLFQAPDAPVRLAEYAVVVPPGMTPQADPTRWLPPAEIKALPGGMKAWIWRTGNLAPLPEEPRAVRPELARPAIRVAVHASALALLEPLDELLLGWLGENSAALQAWFQAFRTFSNDAKGLQLLSARLSRLTEHQHDGGQPGQPETIAATAKGDRATLFWWLARQRGLDACLVRVAPLARLPLRNPLDPDDYAMELVRVRLHGREHWYDPGVDGGLIDHVRAGLRGRTGWLVGCPHELPETQRQVEVPMLGAGLDTRRLQGTIDWAADGSVRAEVTEQLSGALAGAVRRFFWQSKPGDYSALVSDLAGETLQGASGVLLDIDGLADLGGPLTLRYRLTAPAQAERAAQLQLGLLPVALGQAYASPPSRVSHLLFGWGADEHVQLAVRSGRPLKVAAGKQAASNGPVSWQVEVQPQAEQLVLTKRLHSTPAVVAPEDYPGFAAVLRQLDAAERIRIQR